MEWETKKYECFRLAVLPANVKTGGQCVKFKMRLLLLIHLRSLFLFFLLSVWMCVCMRMHVDASRSLISPSFHSASFAM